MWVNSVCNRTWPDYLQSNNRTLCIICYYLNAVSQTVNVLGAVAALECTVHIMFDDQTTWIGYGSDTPTMSCALCNAASKALPLSQ